MQDSFCDLHVCRKKHVFMYYAHVKRLQSVQWRSLYGDTATMQELLLKTCTTSARSKKKVWNETVTESCMGQDCRSTAQKIVEEKKAEDEQQQPKQPPSSTSKV